MPTVDDICRRLDVFAPAHLAAEWDNTGLLLGDGSTPVQRVLTCLTLTDDVADEAIAGGVQLIVTHHPILFSKTQNLSTRSRDGQLLWSLSRAGIAVYSPHTRFDNAEAGINRWIADQFGLVRIRPLRILKSADRAKIVTFVPEAELEKVSKAMFAAGAGEIGEYSECSFRLPGTGTFRGSAASDPTVGRRGVSETVPEVRLEVVCPSRLVESAVSALVSAHSYEEPAYDIYPLQSVSPRVGEGRFGELDEAVPLAEMIRKSKDIFRINQLQYVDSPETSVKRVAIACGAAGEFVSDAIRRRADLFITGELRFHESLQARTAGLAVILLGHYASERPAVEYLGGWIAKQFPDVLCSASARETDPLNYG